MEQPWNRSGAGSEEVEETSLLEDDPTSEDESFETLNLTGQSLDSPGQGVAVPQPPLPSYKQRLDEFKKLFRELPETERLILDYPCALQRDIFLQGRLYLTENWLCFYSNVFRGTKIIMTLKDITGMTREKTARWIPNAIQICTSAEKHFFSSFSAREKSYLNIFRMWQNTLMQKPLTSQELWQMVKQHYGNDLGLTQEEMESLEVSPELSAQNSLTHRPSYADDGLGKPERPNTLRLPVIEYGPLESSTPQSEEFPSPINSVRTDEFRKSPSLQRSSALSLDRFAPERLSKDSSQSLDLNANENEELEKSGSESTEEVEDKSGISEEPGRQYLNKVFHISASRMFELLFTNSSFTRRFMEIRKITNPTISDWQKDASGDMKRTLNYTITINNVLIGNFSTATETQKLYKDSREGQYYHVDAEVYTHEVPYHDYFYTHNRYYIIGISKRKCRLRVFSDVRYTKQPWGLIKGFISKNSWNGIEDYFKQLEAELLVEEVAAISQAGGESGKMGGLRRRRTYSRTLPDHVNPSKQYSSNPEHRDGQMGPMDRRGGTYVYNIALVAGMSAVLMILIMLNLGLFFKLWAMEDVAQRMFMTTKHRLRESSFGSPYSPKQEAGYRTTEDMHLVKHVLQDSINLLEQLRTSLIALQHSFAMANQTAEPQ